MYRVQLTTVCTDLLRYTGPAGRHVYSLFSGQADKICFIVCLKYNGRGLV